MPIDANTLGFLPDQDGHRNAKALQAALDHGGTVVIDRPGVYPISATVLIGSGTRLVCGAGVRLRKVAAPTPFSHVLLNRGALDGSWDSDITIDGLHIEVAGLDHCDWQVFGLRGQLALLRVRDVAIYRFRCHDLGKMQFAIHICTFSDLLIDDVIIAGKKDGVHLGRGERFTIRNGVFRCYDDAIALNAHDYDTSNPELGWIEGGLIENCHDCFEDPSVGFFARILAGAWIPWQSGMSVRKSDTVISEGRLYRVRAEPDHTQWISTTRPTHARGTVALDGIAWVMVQEDTFDTAGVRNVTFRDIHLAKPRTAFSVHFDNDHYSRSYYPGARMPRQEGLTFAGIRVLYDQPTDFLAIGTPIDQLMVVNSTLRNNAIRFVGAKSGCTPGPTALMLSGCTFAKPGALDLFVSTLPEKDLMVTATGNLWLDPAFTARAIWPGGTLQGRCDLPGVTGEGGLLG